jgi:hypothetical protein
MESRMTSSIKSTAMIVGALASAMSCYAVSVRASTERAGIDAARQKIVRDAADIRLLEAELRTRARLPELQRWNEQVLALAPPRAEQLLGNPVLLASYAVTPPRAAVELAAVVRNAPPTVPPVQQVVYATPRQPSKLGADAALIGAVASSTPAGFQKIALR